MTSGRTGRDSSNAGVNEYSSELYNLFQFNLARILLGVKLVYLVYVRTFAAAHTSNFNSVHRSTTLSVTTLHSATAYILSEDNINVQ